MPVHEHDLNQAIARALDEMRRGWDVVGESPDILRGGLRPDIAVRQPHRPTVLIENEFAPAVGVEDEAHGRLGKPFRDSNDKVRIAVALRSPALLRESDIQQLDNRVRAAEFDYALFSREGEKIDRFPEAGWLIGNLGDLAGFIHRASVPADAVRDAANSLECGVQDASKILKEADPDYPDTGAKIGKLLQQEYGEQTRRMATAILVNAMSYQNHLAGHKGILPIEECRGPYGNKPRASAIADEWGKILDINYWPIFEVARDILRAMPSQSAQQVVVRLADTVKAMTEDAVHLSHDLFGKVFQRLIADRKFLATFYTRPPSAALLANLAIPEDAPFAGGDWKNNAKDYVVADFACGTGALLTAAYQRVSELHERIGGDAADIHPEMMAKSVVGCDVMPAAAHLTASILSGAHPTREFDETRIYTMPYGEPKKGEYRIGSLELLAKQSFLSVLSASAKRERGSGNGSAELHEIPWRSANLVIMNPPFTNPTNHEGAHKDIPNPAFAAFGADEELQSALGERSGELRMNTCGNGNAGLASDFVALTDKMVAPGGVVALVLPLSAMAGESWKDAREMWGRQYEDIRVVTLSAPRIRNCAFSADTGMGEVLFVGRRRNGVPLPPQKRRGIFIVLNKLPETEIAAAEIAQILRRAMRGSIRKLEDGPSMEGTRLNAGETHIGEMLDAPLPAYTGDPWGVVRMRDFSLAQTVHALTRGRLWLPGELKSASPVPIRPFSDFAERGFIGRDINGMERGGKARGPFDIAPIRPGSLPTYPCLWAHKVKEESRMQVKPDREARVRRGMQARAMEVWGYAGRVHHNADFQFNAQPLAVAMTEKPTIGGQAWPNIVLKNQGQESAFVLWGNSTLGLLLYWWWSNKQQEGRGRISPRNLEKMPTLDVSALSPAQLSAARKGFDAMKNRELLPFYRAADDPARAELDRVVLCDILGLPKKVLSGVALVREKLCAEPSVFGGKKNGD